jgi:hypothetical protein
MQKSSTRHDDATGIHAGKGDRDVRLESAVHAEYYEQRQSIERDVLIMITEGYER